MEAKKLYPCIYLKQGKAQESLASDTVISDNPVALAKAYCNKGADAILVFDLSDGDAEHEAAIGMLKKMVQSVEVPVYAGGNINRMEDVKKILYAGASKAFLNYTKESNIALTKEVSEKFGKEKIYAVLAYGDKLQNEELLGGVLLLDEAAEIAVSESFEGAYIVIMTGSDEKEDWLEMAEALLKKEKITGVGGGFLNEAGCSFQALKTELENAGIPVSSLKSRLAFSELTLNSDGLIPVIVQDYKTLEVLQLAYMNEESFQNTLRTGLMTYYSRSRQCLWVKGETSGHFQYVKELTADCDKDTLLVKVSQVGAACHTGKRSCFFENLFTTEYNRTNPHKVLEEVYHTIADRKEHPKEGSYTNYLFEKGIDKILKKVGEEATEIVIAAKNPDCEEIKYEMADFLYHAMVLMVEKGVTWEEIAKELAERH